MDKKSIILSVIFLVCCSALAIAQNNSSKQRRALNAALTTLEEYSLWCTVENLEAYDEFLDLFSTQTAPVYNDLLGISKSNKLTPEEYAKTMQRGVRNKKVNVKNVKTEGVKAENGQIRVLLSFNKVISYIDSCGTYFSSKEFFDVDHQLLMTLVYDEDSKKCKIEGITGKIASKKQLPNQYVVFASMDDRDVDLSYQKMPIHLNSYHQAFLEGTPATISAKNFSYPNQNVRLKPYFSHCNMSMKYHVRKFKLKPRYDLGIGKAYIIEGLGAVSNEKNSMSSFGLDLGYMLFSNRFFSLSVFTGVNMSRSRLDFGLNQEDYSYQSNADVDGDSYIRHYQNLSLSQTFRLQDISFPLYVDMGFSFSKVVAFYVDLGIRYNLNVAHAIDGTKGSAYIYGIYPQYDNMMLNENWPYNGFGDCQLGQDLLDHADILDLKKTGLDVMGSAGFRFSIPNVPLSVDLGVSYLMGLGEVIKTTTPIDQISATSNPIIYNTISGESSVEHLHNLTEAIQSVKRRSLRLSLGLILSL